MGSKERGVRVEGIPGVTSLIFSFNYSGSLETDSPTQISQVDLFHSPHFRVHPHTMLHVKLYCLANGYFS